MVSFNECLTACAENSALVAEFDRLTGSNLSMKGSPLDLAIDEATGRTTDEIAKFCCFVFDCVYLPVVSKMNAGREE